VKIVVAPDKFAGTLTAPQAAAAMTQGWRRTRRADELVAHPMSDGGPGFLEVLQAAVHGRTVSVDTVDPLGRPIHAAVVLTESADGAVAYVESAQAVGLHLLTADERDPERTTSTGLTALLEAAVTPGVTQVVVGLGGSATNDGGQGLLESLPERVAQRLQTLDLVLASDVSNPLLGPNGASAVFAPQKGASREAVARLEGRMQRWVDERPDIAAVAGFAGAGAAGGLGAALLALGAHRRPGAHLVAEATRLAEQIETADLVITGEGAYDATSLRGKVVATVAGVASAAAVPCAVVAGRIDVGAREAAAHGIDEMLALTEVAGSEEAAQADAFRWAIETTARLARRWGAG